MKKKLLIMLLVLSGCGYSQSVEPFTTDKEGRITSDCLVLQEIDKGSWSGKLVNKGVYCKADIDSNGEG